MQPPAQEVSLLLIAGSRQGTPEEGLLYSFPLPKSLPKHLQLAMARRWSYSCLYPPANSL